MSKPRAIIIAGPNGAGKTTFARALFDVEFENGVESSERAYHLNADELARTGLGNLSAGKQMLEFLDQAIAERRSFIVETTLSSMGYLRRINHWKSVGYDVHLHFLKLKTPELAIERVARRVQAGGHHIPTRDIVRRFHRGLDLFEIRYKSIVDSWEIWRSYEGGFERVENSDQT